jgi:hypothetical protein
MAGPKIHSSINMPRDASGTQIPALAQSTVTGAAVSATAASLALPAGAKLVDLNTSTDMWYLFGTSGTTVTSTTGHFMAAGAGRTYDVGDHTHISVLRSSADGRATLEVLI